MAEHRRDREQDPNPESIELELTDTLDLHTFSPQDAKELVREMIEQAIEKGWDQIRLIHGKGKGVQRRIVRSVLESDPRVARFETGPDWGSTVAILKGEPDSTTGRSSNDPG